MKIAQVAALMTYVQAVFDESMDTGDWGDVSMTSMDAMPMNLDMMDLDLDAIPELASMDMLNSTAWNSDNSTSWDYGDYSYDNATELLNSTTPDYEYDYSDYYWPSCTLEKPDTCGDGYYCYSTTWDYDGFEYASCELNSYSFEDLKESYEYWGGVEVKLLSGTGGSSSKRAAAAALAGGLLSAVAMSALF